MYQWKRDRRAGTIAPLVAAVFLTGVCALAQTAAPQRIPRQTQSAAAAIQGRITNELGLGVGGAVIRVIPESGGTALTIETTGDGVFRIPGVPPGRYRLTATRDGFEPFEWNGLTVNAGQIVALQGTLTSIGAPNERTIPPPPEPPSVYRNYPIPQLPQQGVVVTPPVPQVLAPESEVFTPVPNRWGYDFPEYRRYGPQGTRGGDTQQVPKRWWDPYNRNKLKGDYPILGQQTFLLLTLSSDSFTDGRRLPVGSGVSANDPDNEGFFRRFGQLFYRQNFSLGVDLFHGDTSYKPFDWRVKFTPEFNINFLKVREQGIVNIDVRKGTQRVDTQIGLQEAFVEAKLFDVSRNYDFVSARAGIQTFNSDFKGFIFFDQEPGLRIFGNAKANRYQYNLAYFSMLEKDTNSGLNSMSYRGQQVFIANVYKQDFLKLGYSITASFHYNKDDPTLKFDNNNFLVRPAPIGVARPHSIRSYYYGFAGEGHFGRINIDHAYYHVVGTDKRNLIAGREVAINAQMAALELSIDKDWVRFRGSAFWSSGDDDPRDSDATGFDAIMDNSNFSGGFFSFWNREGIRLTGTGVGLVHDNSLIPSLRSSKPQGQANYVNPGIFVYNTGADIEVTPKIKGFLNFSAIHFHHTEPLELVLFQKPIRRGVGADSGVGFAYRPALTDNMVITGGFNIFKPFAGFRDIYDPRVLYSGFANVRFLF